MTTKAEWDSYAATATAAAEHARGVVDTDISNAFAMPAEPILIDRYREQVSTLNGRHGRAGWSATCVEAEIGAFHSNDKAPDEPPEVSVRCRLTVSIGQEGKAEKRERWGIGRAKATHGEPFAVAITAAARLAVLDALQGIVGTATGSMER